MSKLPKLVKFDFSERSFTKYKLEQEIYALLEKYESFQLEDALGVL